MAIEKIYAQVACHDLAQSKPWFQNLFGRAPDTHPMTGLVEWRHGGAAGLQLFESPDNAGRSTLTLIVDDLKTERARLGELGFETPDIESGEDVFILRLSDPDKNLIVLAEPREENS